MGVNWIIDGKINCQCILWIYWRLRGLTPITCDSRRQMDRIEEDSFFYWMCVCVLCIRLTQIDIHQQISKLFSGVCLDRCSCKTRCYIPRNVDIYESLILYRSLHFFILQIKIIVFYTNWSKLVSPYKVQGLTFRKEIKKKFFFLQILIYLTLKYLIL